MITYVNNSNAGQYRILYEKATRTLMAHDDNNQLITPSQINEAANQVPLIMPTVLTAEELAAYEPNIYYRWDSTANEYVLAEESEVLSGETYYKATDITSLNEYFSYIKNLAEIDPLYTVLPLDEDVFDVDLNTRKITIPSHFSTNGISVQGDEVAEVVYFKVNRFFDAQDLSNEDIKIYIQWRSAQADEDGTLIEGVSVPWVEDLTTYPNYILFGWPISSKITGKAGTIDFAIRFFKFQDRKVTYSLSTLTHSVDVKESLDFDISTKLIDVLDGSANSSLVLDDSTSMILNRLENSQVVNGGVVAGTPYFFMVSNPGPNNTVLTTEVDSTVGDGTGIIDGIQTSEGLVKEFWLAKNETTGILDVPTTFKVQGSGDGRISYSWKKLNLADKSLGDAVVYSNQMLETEDTEAQTGKTYYTKTTSGTDVAYTLVTDPIFDTEDDDYQTLYERYSVANITGVGYYIVTINNRVQNSLVKKESIEMVVSNPLEPQNNVAVPDSGILYIDEEGAYKLTLSTDAEPLDNGVLTYQWYYAKDGGGIAAATAIEGATNSSYEIIGGAPTSLANGGPEGDGFYYVIITNNMNGEKASINGNSDGTRVTHAASKLTVTIPETHKKSYSLAEVTAVGGMKIQAAFDESQGENRDLNRDTVTYQWYRYNAGDGHTVDVDRIAADEGTYVENEDIVIEGANEDTYMPILGGYFYFCKVTNTYNGTTADSYSPFFYISA